MNTKQYVARLYKLARQRRSLTLLSDAERAAAAKADVAREYRWKFQRLKVQLELELNQEQEQAQGTKDV